MAWLHPFFVAVYITACVLSVSASPLSIDCALVLCALPDCPEEEHIPADFEAGLCCPTCPPDLEPPTLDCRLVRCASPPCPDPLPPPKGKCCPVCPDCPIKGQVFTECGSSCPPNCTTPNPICTLQCVRRCECPRGTVIDKISNSCVTLEECPSTCPPDTPTVNCFVNPCMFATCPAHPRAKCRADFCGGCFARFFAKGNEVTESCECPVQGQLFTFCGSACPPNCTTPNPICTRQCVARCECPGDTVIDTATNTCVHVKKCPRLPPVRPCPPDKPLVACFVDPCMFATCPAHPGAVCVSDYCGGCFARFFKKNVEVTKSCGAAPQLALE